MLNVVSTASSESIDRTETMQPMQRSLQRYRVNGLDEQTPVLLTSSATSPSFVLHRFDIFDALHIAQWSASHSIAFSPLLGLLPRIRHCSGGSSLLLNRFLFSFRIHQCLEK